MANEGGLEPKRSLTILILYAIMLFGALYLAQLGVESAGFYLSLGLVFTSLIFVAYIVIKRKEWKNLVKLQMEDNTLLGNKWFAIGFTLPFLLFFMKLTTFMSPQLIFSQKTFQALAVGTPSFNQILTIGFFAGTFEELTLGIAAMIIGGIAVVWIFESFGKSLQGKSLMIAWIVGGEILSAALFTFFHTLNPVYTTQMFIVALVFRLVFNLIIFFTSLSIAVGYHIANNLVALGPTILLAGFLTPQGILLLLILVIIYISAILSFIRKKKTPGEKLEVDFMSRLRGK